MKSMRVFTAVFLLVGLGMLIGAGLLVRNTQSFVARAASAQGQVVDLIPSRSSQNSSTTWAPQVRFTAADGQVVEFQSSTSSNPPAYARGETVTVLYDPATPQSARLKGLFSLWGGPLILGGLGAVFFLIGLGFLLVPRLTRRSDEHLRSSGRLIETQLQSVEENTSVSVGGRHPYRIISQWQNPADLMVYVFHSHNIWYDPTQYLGGKQIKVYIDGDNPKKYFVDTSFLPKLAN